MLVWILLNTAAWFIVGVEVHNLWRRRKQAGAPRPTTTPASPEGRSAVVMGGTTLGSPASPLPPTTLDSLQALGQRASHALSHVAVCSQCQAQLGHRILQYRTLAQAVVDLASTSASEATNWSVVEAPPPVTSGSSASTESSHIWINATWRPAWPAGWEWRLAAQKASQVLIEVRKLPADVSTERIKVSTERIKVYPDGPSRAMNEY